MYETTFRTIDLRPGTVQEALEWQPPGPGMQPDSDSSEADSDADEEDFESLERAAAESSSAGSESLGLAVQVLLGRQGRSGWHCLRGWLRIGKRLRMRRDEAL